MFPFPSERRRKDESLLRMRLHDIETSGSGKRGLTLEGSDRLKAAKFLRDLMHAGHDDGRNRETDRDETRLRGVPVRTGPLSTKDSDC